MICGVGFYAFVIGNLSSIIETMDIRAAKLTEKNQLIAEFVRRQGLPPQIDHSIKRFVENNHVEQL